jgi:RimJ/RimL family protein N-acetyltransferase
MRPLREDISIGPVTTSLRKAAVEDGWFDNEEDNRNMGFGSGETGRAAIREGFAGLLASDTGEVFLVGIYRTGDPVGYFVIEQVGGQSKTAKLHMYVCPDGRKHDVFRTSLLRMLSLLFENGTYRTECEIFSFNKKALSAFLNLGFKREGYKRASYWVDGNPMTQVLIRMLRKDFKEMFKGVI